MDIRRGDYREFLELVIIFLGGELPNGNIFRHPGAYHHARWMAKGIYSLKIFMFRHLFKLQRREIAGLRDVCLFLVKLYVKAWFRASSSIKAPNNDIEFIKESIRYQDIDSQTSEIILKKISNHLWYLGTEQIAFTFFDDNVSIPEKRKMVLAINNNQLPICKNFSAKPAEIRERFVHMNPSDFVSVDTRAFSRVLI